jgi:Putative auto-transporter adhesin, head GIN domain
MKSIILFSLLALVFATGCREINGRRVRGNGNAGSETRTVSSFTNIDVSGAINVHIKQDSTSSVRIEGDENLLQYIDTRVDGNTLIIETEDNIWMNTKRSMNVYVSNPSYSYFEVSGASKLTGESPISSSGDFRFKISGASSGRLEVDAPKVAVELGGASKITLSGRTKEMDVDVAGASKANCYDLLAETVRAEASGASGAEVYSSVKIIPRASGASHIYYKGNATEEDRSESGAGKVKKVN